MRIQPPQPPQPWSAHEWVAWVTKVPRPDLDRWDAGLGEMKVPEYTQWGFLGLTA